VRAGGVRGVARLFADIFSRRATLSPHRMVTDVAIVE
jgi:hypothetical protein